MATFSRDEGGDATGRENPNTLTVDGQKTITANFYVDPNVPRVEPQSEETEESLPLIGQIEGPGEGWANYRCNCGLPTHFAGVCTPGGSFSHGGDYPDPPGDSPTRRRFPASGRALRVVTRGGHVGAIGERSVFWRPLVPWFAIFLTGSFAGYALIDLKQDGLNAGSLVRNLRKVGIALVIMSIMVVIGYKVLKVAYPQTRAPKYFVPFTRDRRPNCSRVTWEFLRG